jgi:hypothetical protein
MRVLMDGECIDREAIRWARGVLSIGDLNVSRFAEALKDAVFGACCAKKRHGPSWSDGECHGGSRPRNDPVNAVAFGTQKEVVAARARAVRSIMKCQATWEIAPSATRGIAPLVDRGEEQWTTKQAMNESAHPQVR